MAKKKAPRSLIKKLEEQAERYGVPEADRKQWVKDAAIHAMATTETQAAPPTASKN